MTGTRTCEICENATPAVRLALVPGVFNGTPRRYKGTSGAHRGLLCPSCTQIYGPFSPRPENYSALVLLRVAAALERIEAKLSAK